MCIRQTNAREGRRVSVTNDSGRMPLPDDPPAVSTSSIHWLDILRQ
jgi:hypothetical protein